ncbi:MULTISPECIES: hypothetical protein [Pedobacter]|uniref:Uncharacterized protein n=1 Tax=Pedobacter suwonensis TaxID=332999 RepID=A0A1I0TTD3_9SPHI|nr:MULTISPECIES: hypothetical protein [Pedobacter]SFA55002.1 hypothetical protein SAMN04488511_11463 [Pedobacter suwonensis]
MKVEITTMADALRKTISPQNVNLSNKDPVIKAKKPDVEKKATNKETLIIELIREFDCTGNTHMLHPRLNRHTVQLLNRLKLASGIDMNKVIAFALHRLFDQHPEIKKFIKTSLENFEL